MHACVLVLASMSVVVLFQKACMRSKVRKVAMVTGFEEQILRSIPAEEHTSSCKCIAIPSQSDLK